MRTHYQPKNNKFCEVGNNAMKVLLLVAEFPPTTYAGLATYSYNVAKHLQRNNDVKVSVLVNCLPFRRYISNLRYTYKVIKKINKLKKEKKLEIIYAITFRPEFTAIGLYAKILHLPFVSHGVGLDIYSSNPMFIQARKTAYSISEQLVCGASFQKEMISHEGAPYEKINVVLGGVDTEVFRPMHGERYGFRRHFDVEDRFVLLSLGRLVKRKGFDDALKALTYLGDIDDIFLLIVGEGPEKPFLTKLVEKLSLSERVRFLNFLSTNYLPAVYNTADLFIAPFRVIGKDMEGTPLVVQEALSCGTPVISTNTAGVPELIENGKSGFTVNPNSPEKIAEKIRLLYENRKLYAKMATEARRRAQRLLDWKVAVGKTEKVLKKALVNKR